MSLRSEIHDGLFDIAAPALAAVPIGVLFGAIAAAKGLSPAEAMLMSLTVFAGGAQFAAIEQWVHPAPILALAFGTLLINLRHVLMGASIAPKMAGFPPWLRALAAFPMADENWALSERRARTHPLTPAYYVTMAAVFYVNWQIWTATGAVLGPLLGDPARVGADFAFTALFIGLVAGFWKGPSSGATIAASALAAALVKVTAGAPWHVPAGAIAGIAAAWLFARDDAPAPLAEAAPDADAVAREALP